MRSFFSPTLPQGLVNLGVRRVSLEVRAQPSLSPPTLSDGTCSDDQPLGEYP